MSDHPEEKEFPRPQDWKGWDISSNFKDGVVEACYDPGDGSPLQVWCLSPRNALIFADILLKKAMNILDDDSARYDS